MCGAYITESATQEYCGTANCPQRVAPRDTAKIERCERSVCGGYVKPNGQDTACSFSDCPMHIIDDPPAKVVDHPSHYGGDVPHEVVKCLAAWGLESDALLWNAVKYIARHKHKGDALTDLRKAEWYLLRRIVQLIRD